MNRDLKHILVLDIETVSAFQNFADLSAALQDHWRRKAQFIRNENESSTEDLYFDRSAIYAEFGRIIVIAVAIFHEIENGEYGLRVTSFQDDDEHKLLSAFSDFLNAKFDPDQVAFCAHNGKEFDYPYLCRRLLVNGIRIPKALDIAEKKPWEINHLDTMDMWKFGDRKSFTSLDLLTSLFGIDSSKSDIDGSQVNRVYYEEEDGLSRIAEYCRGDVVATAQVFLKLSSLPIIKQSHITIVS